LREIVRVLDLNAGWWLWIHIAGRKFSFLRSDLDGEGYVRAESERSGDVVVSNNWQELADFLRIDDNGEIKLSDVELYELVLNELVRSFVNQQRPETETRRLRLEYIKRLAETEPEVERLLRDIDR